MGSSLEMIRVGVAIRREETVFRLTGKFSLFGGTAGPLFPPGVYTARITEPGCAMSWGVRVRSFQLRDEAEHFAELLRANGESPAIHSLGRPLCWGGRELEARIYTVSLGEWESEADAARGGAELLNRIALIEGTGLKRYPDEIPAVTPLRLTPPRGGRIFVEGENGESGEYPSPLRLEPVNPDSCFELASVRIGIDFHWDHEESLAFRGALELTGDGNRITAVNDLPLEDYLAALLGSEMRGDWPLESLTAQAVAARSTVLATRGRHHYGEPFDLCHDDHCQCYQGIGRESELAREALARSHGAVLESSGRVVDARYAKSCGGLSELYATAWEDWEVPGICSVPCGPLPGAVRSGALEGGDWSDETFLRKVLSNTPEDAACNPSAVAYPASSREMERLYRWSVTLSAGEMETLAERRLGRSLGVIRRIEVLERGVSGRICYLRLVGDAGMVVVGKELRIRRLFSESHLPSSAFVVDPLPYGGFRLEGIGWGHGVGLCQLGSAALAERGWRWEKILAHYYPETYILHAGTTGDQGNRSTAPATD